MKYTASYCEENVWYLCADPAVSAIEKKVVWVSSLQKICPIWCQRLAASDGEPVWWDYHVFLLSLTGDQWQVWDLDTRLGLPVEATEYFTKAFRQPMPIPPIFRVMEASYYRRVFSSDRSHMKRADGSWMATPPAWPAIGEGASTFAEMLDMRSTVHGDLLGLDEIEYLVSRTQG
jgi:hypothetical protein